MLTFELGGELDTATYKPLQEGELGKVKLTNKSRKRIVVSKVLLKFEWMGNSYHSTECSVDIPPSVTMDLPRIRFRIHLGAPAGNNNYKIGIAYKILVGERWRQQTSYVPSGEYIEIKPLPTKNFKVFVSHSNERRDRKLIQACKAAFEACGITTYFAEDDKRGGSILWDRILERINGCDAFLVLWTKSASKSGDVREEIGIANNSHLRDRMVPIVEKGTVVKGSLKTRGIEWIDYKRPNHIIALSEGLKNIMEWANEKESNNTKKAEIK